MKNRISIIYITVGLFIVSVCGCSVMFSSPTQLIFKSIPDIALLYGEFTAMDQDDKTGNVVWSAASFRFVIISNEGEYLEGYEGTIQSSEYLGYTDIVLNLNPESLKSLDTDTQIYETITGVESSQIYLNLSEFFAGDFNLLDFYMDINKQSEYDSANFSGGRRNHLPIADAGPDQTVSVGTDVTLNGTGSSDADDDPILHYWTVIDPGQVSSVLSDTTATAVLKASTLGTYTISLVINDGKANSVADVMTVTAE